MGRCCLPGCGCCCSSIVVKYPCCLSSCSACLCCSSCSCRCCSCSCICRCRRRRCISIASANSAFRSSSIASTVFPRARDSSHRRRKNATASPFGPLMISGTLPALSSSAATATPSHSMRPLSSSPIASVVKRPSSGTRPSPCCCCSTAGHTGCRGDSALVGKELLPLPTRAVGESGGVRQQPPASSTEEAAEDGLGGEGGGVRPTSPPPPLPPRGGEEGGV